MAVSGLRVLERYACSCQCAGDLVVRDTSRFSDRILARVQPHDFGLVADALKPVKLPLALVLADVSSEVNHIYFLDDGIASIAAKSPEGQACEAVIIGREGHV